MDFQNWVCKNADAALVCKHTVIYLNTYLMVGCKVSESPVVLS